MESVHKEHDPLRPIESMLDTPSYKLAKFLDKITTYSKTKFYRFLYKISPNTNVKMVTKALATM